MTDNDEPAGERGTTRGDNDGAIANASDARRRRAERLIRSTAPSPENIETLSPEETQQMLHELRVHQIELEMQNEELRESQLALDAGRARYFDLYDLAPIGYCTVSEQGQIVQANLTAARLLGLARGAMIKRPLSQFIMKADQDIYYLCRKHLLNTGQPQSCEFRMLKNDGTPIWVNLAATVALDAEGTSELRAVLSDITERKRLDSMLQENITALEQARTTADKANRAKSEFLSNMSHELRTPLNAILGFAQLIEAGSPAPTPGQKRSVDHILEAGWYLLALVDEILDLAVVESGKLALSMEAISLDEVMDECQAMLELQAQEHGIRIDYPSVATRYYINADRNRVKQVLSNLLSNAIKYNRPDGSVIVDWVVKTAGRILIRVKDTGDGLSPSALAQLFQPFNRLGKEASEAKGTGIGLAMTKRLVELMGGTIGVESTVGVGSVFWIELNLTTEMQTSRLAYPLSAITPRQVQPNAQPHTLLYVEDNPGNLLLVEEIIARRSDIRLLCARDGVRGVEMARESLPDMIVMDINLPGISGLHALKILRTDPTTAHIPVVALGANAIPRDIKIGLEAGFFRYLTKPIKINEFLETLDAVLRYVENKAIGTARKEQH